MDSALEIEGLCVRFRLYDRTLTAVDNVSLRVERGETMALVGESGSGKTVTSLAVIGLLGSKALVASGSIGVGGRDVLALDAEGLRRLRGAEVGTIFQDPMSSLNPMLTIGEQITETLASHRSDSASEHRAKALSLLAQVRIPQPEATLNFYPHQLSGGMRQRVMIAIAIALDPALIIADEPTTALDVTVQAQVLGLIRDLITAKNAACLFISHDMGVVAQVSDKVSIMYAGSIVEKGPTSSVLAQPWHPYTRGLIDCAPAHDTTARRELLPIPGSMPALGDLPSGCPFAPRCFRAEADCREIKPGLLTLPGASDRAVACHHPLIDSVERPELAPTQARSYSITTAAPALDVRHLSQALGQRGIFGARRTRLIVDDVTLQVPAGSTLGVVGESGSGKSTLVRSIMGLYAGTLGEIRVAGAQVPGGTWPRSLRARMQMVFQDSYSSL
ncbi:oligopeptide/dipeptide ABC transporter ATP-binding protein, partial [Mesorhizobium sp. M7D.F.Ca.US.004.01.2.1]|uniref:oligopeptide/dipeptide ABC transporter ATP-binding protein n=1 Tax=Mesorhizobium sp. M7D.F.Ca.US.004.01.2.1 TaxID=2496738 RepID=UPI000FCA272E